MAIKIGPTIKVEGEREYRQSMREITAETKKLKSEMDLLTSSFSSEGKSLDQNRKEQRNLEKQIENTEKALKEQERRLMEVATATDEDGNRTQELKNKTAEFQAVVNNTEKELNELRAQLKAMPNDMQLMGQNLQETGSKMKEHGQALEDTGKQLSKLTVPLLAAGAAAVKFGAEFDAGMSNVKAVMNTTEEGMQQLRDTAIDWGNKTKYSAAEVSDGLYFMGLAGWSAEEAIESIGGVLNLAAAGNLDLARTSDIVTDGMTALGIAADGYTNGIANAEHFSNVLAATMSNSNTTVDLMGETFKYVAPVAGSLGYSIEDLAVSIGIMAGAGIKGSTAGTTLRNIISRMAKPTKEVQEAMDYLGVSLEDADGNTKPFIEVLRDMRREFGNMKNIDDFTRQVALLDMELENGNITVEEYNEKAASLTDTLEDATDVQKAAAAAAIAGQRGMSGLLAIVGASDEEFEGLVKTLNNADDAFDGVGYAAGMAETQMDNLKGDFTKLTSAIGTSQIKISDLVSGPLRKLVQSITDLVVKFNSMDKAQQAQILKWAGIAAAIGPVLIVAGKLEKGIGGLVTGLGKAMTAAGTFSKAMNEGKGVMGSLLTAGLNPVAVGVAAVAAAFAAALVTMKKHNDFINEYVKKQYELTEEEKALAESIESRVGAYNELDKAMKETGQGIVQEYDQIEKLKNEYNELVEATGLVSYEDQEHAMIIMEKLAEALDLEYSQVEALVDENGKLSAAIDDVIQKKKQEATLEAFHEDYIQAIKDQKTAQEELAQALVNKQTHADLVKQAEEELAKATEAYNTAMREGVEQVVLYEDGIRNAEIALEAAKESQEEVNATYDTARETLEKYTSTITNYEEFEKAVTTGADNINEAQDNLIYNIQRAETSSRESLEKQYANAKNNYDAMKKAVEEGASGITQSAVNEAKALVDLTKKELDKLAPDAQQSAKEAIKSYATGAEEEIPTATGKAQKLKEQTLAALEGADTKPVGRNIARGVGSGIAEEEGGVIARASNMITNAIANMKMAARIQSPSRITRDEIGAMMVRGIVKGFEDQEGALDNEAQGLIKGAMNTMTKTASGFSVPLDTTMHDLERAADAQIYNMAGLQAGTSTTKNIQAPISVNVNVNGSVDDINGLANRVADAINEKIIRRNEVFN